MNILITGASRGIGASAYALLKDRGHNVVGHSSKGSDALIAGDLTDPAAPRAIWDTALDELGGQIDVLVNNAGTTAGSPSMPSANVSPAPPTSVHANATGSGAKVKSKISTITYQPAPRPSTKATTPSTNASIAYSIACAPKICRRVAPNSFMMTLS